MKKANIQKANGVYNAYDGQGNFIASAESLDKLKNTVKKKLNKKNGDKKCQNRNK